MFLLMSHYETKPSSCFYVLYIEWEEKVRYVGIGRNLYAYDGKNGFLLEILNGIILRTCESYNSLTMMR